MGEERRPTQGTSPPSQMPTELERRYLIPMCAIGATSSVSELLESGSPVDYVNVQGWTPLLAAVFAGQCEVAAMLIERGAGRATSTVCVFYLLLAAHQTSPSLLSAPA